MWIVPRHHARFPCCSCLSYGIVRQNVFVNGKLPVQLMRFLLRLYQVSLPVGIQIISQAAIERDHNHTSDQRGQKKLSCHALKNRSSEANGQCYDRSEIKLKLCETELHFVWFFSKVCLTYLLQKYNTSKFRITSLEKHISSTEALWWYYFDKWP